MSNHLNPVADPEGDEADAFSGCIHPLATYTTSLPGLNDGH